MKRKLNIVFILMAVSLLGIIIFQTYWTFNAYRVNKEKFDTNINSAMRKAMDSCKKDYFDSIRRVLIKRLSPPNIYIKIDTVVPQYPDTSHSQLKISFIRRGAVLCPEDPYLTDISTLNFYRKKINHKATVPELLTETSFYVPRLIQQIISILGIGSTFSPPKDHRNNLPDSVIHKPNLFPGQPININGELVTFRGNPVIYTGPPIYFNGQPISGKYTTYQTNPGFDSTRYHLGHFGGKKADSSNKKEQTKADYQQKTPVKTRKSKSAPQVEKEYSKGYKYAEKNSIFAYPPNFRKADSLKLYKYFHNELEEMGIYSPFQLALSLEDTLSNKLNLHYSETETVDYKYHGFKLFGNRLPELFIKAKFFNPQYIILKNMVFTLVLSLFLVLFTIFCFNYIFRTFIEQKKLAELKDDFINNMTHELKTPIATITVAIEGLQKFNALNDAEKTQRYLQTSRNELTRLNDLVTKVLDIATFENKEIALVKEQLNVSELVNEVISTEKSTTTKTVDISFINKDDIELIYADKIHFRNVMVNLIDNAIKYADNPVKIDITTYKNGQNVAFSVKDNGIGIPAAHINQVFDKFHRVPTGNVHSVKGTGLGLSYVKYIVEAHGGTIAVKSEINKGSEFIVSIPLGNG